jgi:WD40 repeat protein
MSGLKRFFSLLVLFGVSLINGQDIATRDTTYLLDLAWSPDGNRIAVVGVHPGTLPEDQVYGYSPDYDSHGYLSVLDGNTGETLYEIEPPSAFTSVAWSPDNQRLAMGSFDGTVWIVDANTGEKITQLFGHQSTVTDVDWNQTGTQIVSSGNWDEWVILWDAVDYSVLVEYQIISHTNTVAFNPDNTEILVGTDRGVFLFPIDLQYDGPVPMDYYIPSEGWTASMSYSPDQRLLAVGIVAIPDLFTGEQPSGLLYIIDMESKVILHRIESPSGTIGGIAWSPNQSYLATFNENSIVKIYETEQMQLIASYSTFNARQSWGGIAFSPYGGRLLFSHWINPTSSLANVEGRTFLGDRVIEIVVPFPTLERLNAIAESCLAPEIGVASVSDEARLPEFVTTIETLSDDQIPPGCKADLLAVAEAIQAVE